MIDRRSFIKGLAAFLATPKLALLRAEEPSSLEIELAAEELEAECEAIAEGEATGTCVWINLPKTADAGIIDVGWYLYPPEVALALCPPRAEVWYTYDEGAS